MVDPIETIRWNPSLYLNDGGVVKPTIGNPAKMAYGKTFF